MVMKKSPLARYEVSKKDMRSDSKKGIKENSSKDKKIDNKMAKKK